MHYRNDRLADRYIKEGEIRNNWEEKSKIETIKLKREK